MKKTMLSLAALISLIPSLALAETIMFEQAQPVTGLAGIEVGAYYDYSYTKLEDGSLTSETTVSDIPLFVRIGLAFLEAKLEFPYSNVESVQKAGGVDLSNIQGTGLSDVKCMLKIPLLPLPIVFLSGGLNFVIPAGDPSKLLSAGTDITPFLAADFDLALLKLHGNLGYAFRGKYTPDYGGGKTEITPGNAFLYGLGAELPLGDLLSLNAEIIGTQTGTVTQDGVTVDGSSGSAAMFYPGARLKAGPFKAKIALGIPLSQFSLTSAQFVPAGSAADWRVVVGASLQFGL
jgi:hypothetical protein